MTLFKSLHRSMSLMVVIVVVTAMPAFGALGNPADLGSLARPNRISSLTTGGAVRAGVDLQHVLVMFEKYVSVTGKEHVHARLGASVANSFPRLNMDVVRLPIHMDPQAAVRSYRSQPGVRAASLNSYGYPLEAPDDPYFGYQWYLQNESQEIPAGNQGAPPVPAGEGKHDFDIDAPEGWDLIQSRNRRTVRVAVLDTGIDILHQDFEGKVKACAQAQTGTGLISDSDDVESLRPEDIPDLACYDDYGHGTFTAGLIGAETGNAHATAGIAPDVELLILKVSDTNGRTMTADVIAGLQWAKELDADIINMSFSLGCDPDPVMEAALEDVDRAGILSVVAAGNLSCPLVRTDRGLEELQIDRELSHFRGGNDPTYPGAYEVVLGVGGTEAQGYVWGKSTCNETVDILAPAQTIWAPVPFWASPDGTEAIYGTSAAAPIVAGVAAQVLSVTHWSGDERNEKVRAVLLGSTTEVTPNPGRDAEDCAGLGQVNLASAIEAATDSVPVPVEIAIDIKPGSDENRISAYSPGSLPVAILSNDSIDALSVDIASLAFGPSEARVTRSGVEDVDGDGDLDLVLHFEQTQTGLRAGDSQACLKGTTHDERDVHGCDHVTVR